MGIHDLLPFLKKTTPLALKSFKEWSSNQTKIIVAVDTPIFMHKFAYSVGTGKPLCIRMLKFANELIEQNIEPIFVFDGKKLAEKQNECAKRIQATKIATDRFKIKPVIINDVEFEVERTYIGTKPILEDYEAFKNGLNILNIKSFTAQYEAEALCSYLVLNKQASAVLTEDSDAIAYLSDAVILKWKSDDEVVILIDQICIDLNLTKDQFQDFCVLLGNDFNGRIKGMGPVKALLMIKKYHTLENLLTNNCIEDNHASDMRKTKYIFKCMCFETLIK